MSSASKSDSRCSWRTCTQPKCLERTRLILYPAARQVVDEVEARCVVMYVSVQLSAKMEREGSGVRWIVGQ